LTGASSILLAFVALALLLAGSAVLRLTRRN
jgi:LPXTG-motif cell wall-anchored protein